MGFSTDAIHVGQEPDPLTGAVVAPIYQTSTYVFDGLEKNKGYVYARTTHPNRMALERTLAKLEGGMAAYAFGSGMAAIDAVFRLLRPGEHTILPAAVYGGTFRIVSQLLVEFGLEFSYVDTSQPEKVEAAIKPSTRMIYCETPSNPTMVLTDLAAISSIANRRNLTLVVDNTFLSPYLQQPISFGAHIVIHSMTKY
ncbi:MAG TPA: aminotransferase class I/II-fold pyridoxal phosphate-dependent enzyme, partial [Candidatus Acidoferrales bacterium]|nr:aminotransferase class I/II-fold pyridoxal phosphate-dependent enzyme [Candidatus Acidoferrales bacterium]